MKTYKIKHVRRGNERIVEGTLDELKKYYGYVFEVGASWNRSINKDPKTIKSFMKNLRASFDEKEGCCYERTLVSLIE